MKAYKFEDFAINCTEKKVPTQEECKTYIGLEHMDTKSIFITRWGSEVPITGEKLVMHKGDILFGKRNTYLRRAAIAPHDGVFSAHGMVLRPKTDIVDYDFFALFIASDYFFDKAIQISVGSLSPTVNWKDLKDIEFNLPDMDKQKEIAKVLWSINNTIYSYKEMLKQCDELVKGQFVEMFGDESKHKRIDELCEFFGDGDWIESKDQSEKGIRLIQTGNIGCNEFIEKGSRARYISKETFINLSCTKVLPGDILISRLPDPIGRACIIPDIGESITAVDCAIIRLEKEVLPEYFVNYTLTTDYQSQIESFVTGSTRKRISRANLGGIVIPVPRIDKQKQFVEIYKHLDKSKFAIKEAMNNAHKIFDGILRESLC